MEEKIKKPWYETKKGKFRCIEKGAMNPDGSIYTFRREYEGRTLRENLGLPRPKNRFFED